MTEPRWKPWVDDHLACYPPPLPLPERPLFAGTRPVGRLLQEVTGLPVYSVDFFGTTTCLLFFVPGKSRDLFATATRGCVEAPRASEYAQTLVNSAYLSSERTEATSSVTNGVREHPLTPVSRYLCNRECCGH